MPATKKMMPGKDHFFEDVVIGTELETTSYTVTQKDILTFADLTQDHHPLHTDEEFCKTTTFGRPIAHGLYGLALMGGLKANLKLWEQTSIASLGWDKVRFKAPIFAGDTVHVKVRFIHKRESKKPDRGVVTQTVFLINQKDEIVTEAEHTTLIKRKSEAPANHATAG